MKKVIIMLAVIFVAGFFMACGGGSSEIGVETGTAGIKGNYEITDSKTGEKYLIDIDENSNAEVKPLDDTGEALEVVGTSINISVGADGITYSLSVTLGGGKLIEMWISVGFNGIFVAIDVAIDGVLLSDYGVTKAEEVDMDSYGPVANGITCDINGCLGEPDTAGDEINHITYGGDTAYDADSGYAGDAPMTDGDGGDGLDFPANY